MSPADSSPTPAPLHRLGAAVRDGLRISPWSNVYGVARTLLALSLAGTLACTSNATSFGKLAGQVSPPRCLGLARGSLFCLSGDGGLEAARWLAVALLVVVASGWRPRITCLVHAWLSWSFMASASLQDGGDQVTSILCTLMVPIALTDPRRWHWSSPAPVPDTASGLARSLVAHWMRWAIMLQVAVIYLDASIAKLGVPEWTNGTALYYWFHDPTFGMPSWLAGFAEPFLRNAASLLLLTWGPLLLEFLLGTAWLMRPEWRRRLLLPGVLFHAGIALLMGLPAFAMAMWAALILYLRPAGEPFRLPGLDVLPFRRRRARLTATHPASTIPA